MCPPDDWEWAKRRRAQKKKHINRRTRHSLSWNRNVCERFVFVVFRFRRCLSSNDVVFHWQYSFIFRYSDKSGLWTAFLFFSSSFSVSSHFALLVAACAIWLRRHWRFIVTFDSCVGLRVQSITHISNSQNAKLVSAPHFGFLLFSIVLISALCCLTIFVCFARLCAHFDICNGKTSREKNRNANQKTIEIENKIIFICWKPDGWRWRCADWIPVKCSIFWFFFFAVVIVLFCLLYFMSFCDAHL